MRQWHINPKLLCRKHLLGEHVEHHMFIGALQKEKSIQGFIDKGLVEVETLLDRHEELAKELKRRGYNHKSPLQADKNLLYSAGKVDKEANLRELYKRCPKCRKRIENIYSIFLFCKSSLVNTR